jgi:hypothetical protein
MTHPFSCERFCEIIKIQIARDETLGSQRGGSGHLGYVEYSINSVTNPVKTDENWKITYQYKVTVTTEFTIYPDNPPQEYVYEKTIAVDEKGTIISDEKKKLLSSNWALSELTSKDNVHVPPEDMIQKVIDPETGRDITSKYISERLKKLEIIADNIIQLAQEEAEVTPEKVKEIYEWAYWELHNSLGMGSIGPATAAAGPLLSDKQIELADSLDISEAERLN